MDLSNFRSTQFVSQYAGLPIDEFLQSARALQQRAEQNTQQLDQLELMAANIRTLDIDQSIKDARLAQINKQMEALAASGAYEHATDQVRMQARDFARDEDLMNASREYSRLQQMKEEAKAVGATEIQLQKIDNAMQLYAQAGGAKDGATLQDLSFYKEKNLSAEIDALLKGQMASGSIKSAPDGQGYIVTSTNEYVTKEALRTQALSHLASNPEYQRQIEDMARLNVYNQTLQNTGDNTQAYNMYNNVDAQTLGNYQNNIIENIIAPSVEKYSYRKTGTTLKGDPVWAARAAAAQKAQAHIPISGATDMIDLGTVPKNSKEFRAKQTEFEQSVAALQTQLAAAESAGNEQEASQIREQLNMKQTGLDQLNQVYTKYIQQIEDPTLKIGAVINSAVKSGMFDMPGALNPETGNRGANPGVQAAGIMAMSTDNPNSGANVNKYVTQMLEQPEFAQYIQQFNISVDDIRSQVEDKGALSLYQKGQDDRWFSMGTDFDSYLDDVGQTTMPQMYAIDDKALRERATTAARSGDVTFYNSETTGPVTDDALLQKLPYEIVGVTSMTEKGHMYTVRFADELADEKKYDSDVNKYAGQTMLISVGNSNINQVVGEEMMADLVKGSAITEGGQYAQTAAMQYASMLGVPPRYAEEITSIGGDAKSSSTSLYHRNKVKLADVSVNPNGFYTVTLMNPNGTVNQTISDMNQFQAMSVVNGFYNAANP